MGWVFAGGFPHAEWTRFGEAGPLWTGDGLVGAKTRFPWVTGPAGDGVACHEEYSALATAGVTLCRGYQVFRPEYGRYSQPGNPRPMPERQQSPRFSSNGSPLEPMIGSGKIHMVGADVGFQSGRATE